MHRLALRGVTMTAPVLASSTALCSNAFLSTSPLPPHHFTSPSSPSLSRPFTTTPPAPSSPPPPPSPSSLSSPSPTASLYMWGEAKALFHDPAQKQLCPTPTPYLSPSPTSPLTSVSFGQHHYALLTADGAVYTAGVGTYAELGYPSKAQPTPRRVPHLPPCVSVHCGEWQTAALATDGSVWTWGWGGNWLSPNALGHGRKVTCAQPTRVEGLKERVTQLAGGKEHCLALTERGELYAWGRGEFGRLGLGGSGNQLSPVRVDALTGPEMRVRQVVCGSSFNGAVLESGGLMTWGRNEAGQLGLGVGLTLDAYSMESVPSRVEFDYESVDEEAVTVRAVTAGERHMLALTDRGQVYLFGLRMWMKPVRVRGDHGMFESKRMKAVGAGKNWSAAIDEDGSVWTWGKGGNGCLGHPDRRDEKEPRKIAVFGPGAALGRAESIMAGGWMDKVAVIARK